MKNLQKEIYSYLLQIELTKNLLKQDLKPSDYVFLKVRIFALESKVAKLHQKLVAKKEESERALKYYYKRFA